MITLAEWYLLSWFCSVGIALTCFARCHGMARGRTSNVYLDSCLRHGTAENLAFCIDRAVRCPQERVYYLVGQTNTVEVKRHRLK